jgi:transposase
MDAPAAALAHFVGIDGAATSLAVVVLPATGTPGPAQTVANAAAGWRDLQRHLRAQGCRPAATRLVLEATGSYWVGVATALTAAGWAVSVVSPASARAYAKATLRRAKTDAVDAAMLAAYGRDLRPAPWGPPPPEVRELQLRVRQRDDLVALQTQTRNRQHALAQLPRVPDEVTGPAEAVLAVLAEQIARLDGLIQRRALAAAVLAADVIRLDAIKGVGLLTAALVVTELWGLGPNLTPDQAVADAGLDPAPTESGTSVRGGTHISKTGNARLRQALHMAALSAVQHNPTFRAVYQRLVARGKPKLGALVAVAGKLLVVMVTLIRHQRTFDPNWASTHGRHP